jgi:hypothetical protein
VSDTSGRGQRLRCFVSGEAGRRGSGEAEKRGSREVWWKFRWEDENLVMSEASGDSQG